MNTNVQPQLKRYRVLVRETRLFWDTVEVDAATEEEARELARDEMQLDWSDSDVLAVDEEILEVEPLPSTAFGRRDEP